MRGLIRYSVFNAEKWSRCTSFTHWLDPFHQASSALLMSQEAWASANAVVNWSSSELETTWTLAVVDDSKFSLKMEKCTLIYYQAPLVSTPAVHWTHPHAEVETNFHGPAVVQHLRIAPILRFGPRQLGIPSCCAQSRDWQSTGIAIWWPLREILALDLSSAATAASCLQNVVDGMLWHRDLHRCIKWWGSVIGNFIAGEEVVVAVSVWSVCNTHLL